MEMKNIPMRKSKLKNVHVGAHSSVPAECPAGFAVCSNMYAESGERPAKNRGKKRDSREVREDFRNGTSEFHFDGEKSLTSLTTSRDS